VFVGVNANIGALAGPDPAVRAAYAEFDVSTPTAHAIVICHGFGRKFRTPITIGETDRGKLTQFLASGRGSPEVERRAVAAAVAWLGHQPVAPAHDRIHDDPQDSAEDPARLHPHHQEHSSFPRPIARRARY